MSPQDPSKTGVSGVAAGQQGGAGRTAHGAVRVPVGEPDDVMGQAVEVRREDLAAIDAGLSGLS